MLYYIILCYVITTYLHHIFNNIIFVLIMLIPALSIIQPLYYHQVKLTSTLSYDLNDL